MNRLSSRPRERGFPLPFDLADKAAAIIYDMITQGWFVPPDFMVHWQALRNLSIALGAARSLYASCPQYENTVYGRLEVTF
jgi:hypothetical protein